MTTSFGLMVSLLGLSVYLSAPWLAKLATEGPLE